jgi:hypothetical protein
MDNAYSSKIEFEFTLVQRYFHPASVRKLFLGRHTAPAWEPLQKLDEVERPDRIVVSRPALCRHYAPRRGMTVYRGSR